MARHRVALVACIIGIATTLSGCVLDRWRDDAAANTSAGDDRGAAALTAGPSAVSLPAADGAKVASIAIVEGGAADQPTQVVTFGHAFPRGVLTRSLAARIGGDVLPTQVDVKRRHDDGSIRHTVVSVAVPAMRRGASLDVDLVGSSTPSPAASFDPSAALAAGFDARVELVEQGLAYSISAAELLRAGGQKWLSGPLVSEVRLRGIPRAGATPHPSLQVLFDVRFYSPRHARVSITIENVFIDAPGDRVYDVRVALAGQAAPVFERAGVQHFHQARWRKTFVWGGSESTLMATADWRVLAAAGAIPNYDPSITVDPAGLDELAARFAQSRRDLLEPAIIQPLMPMAGGRDDLGMLPRWTVLALLSRDARAYRAMLGVGEAAAAFSVHYRNRANELVTIDAHPTITLNRAAGVYSDPADRLPPCDTCTSPYRPDSAHQPSLAFVPYLVSGDPFYLDELVQWANWNLLNLNFLARGQARGLVKNDETRGQAWSLRTLGHAAWIAPDDDRNGRYFASKVAENLAWFNASVVGANPLGLYEAPDMGNNSAIDGRPDPLMAPQVRFYTSPWMTDFLLLVTDNLLRQGFADARVLRDWLARSPIGRLTTPAEYNPYDGAPYHLAYIGGDGRHYTRWADVYRDSFAGRTTPAPDRLPSLECAMCYPAIAQAALAGPVRDRLAGAAPAREFLVQAFTATRPIFALDPTWAIVP